MMVVGYFGISPLGTKVERAVVVVNCNLFFHNKFYFSFVMSSVRVAVVRNTSQINFIVKCCIVYKLICHIGVCYYR